MFRALFEIALAGVVLIVVMFLVAMTAALAGIKPDDTGLAPAIVLAAMLVIPTVVAGYVLARRL
jgi:hypothetical protein